MTAWSILHYGEHVDKLTGKRFPYLDEVSSDE